MLESIVSSDGIDSGDIGYWLLVILSTFLQQAPSSLEHWGILRKILPVVGWSDEDTWLLVRGLSTASLLKPESDVTQDTFLHVSDPYWYWMIPTQSYQRGWLPLEQIHRLKHQLATAHDAIMRLDPAAIGADFRAGLEKLPSGEGGQYTTIAYDEALAMLQAAEKAICGLFMVIS